MEIYNGERDVCSSAPELRLRHILRRKISKRIWSQQRKHLITALNFFTEISHTINHKYVEQLLG